MNTYIIERKEGCIFYNAYVVENARKICLNEDKRYLGYFTYRGALRQVQKHKKASMCETSDKGYYEEILL